MDYTDSEGNVRLISCQKLHDVYFCQCNSTHITHCYLIQWIHEQILAIAALSTDINECLLKQQLLLNRDVLYVVSMFFFILLPLLIFWVLCSNIWIVVLFRHICIHKSLSQRLRLDPVSEKKYCSECLYLYRNVVFSVLCRCFVLIPHICQ